MNYIPGIVIPYERPSNVEILRLVTLEMRDTELLRVVVCPAIPNKYKNLGIGCLVRRFFGNPRNRLERLVKGAARIQANPVVLVQPDRPFITSQMVLDALKIYKENNLQYLAVDPSAPKGLQFKIIAYLLLLRALNNSVSLEDDNKIFPWIERNGPEPHIVEITGEYDKNESYVVDSLEAYKLVSKPTIKLNAKN